MYTWGYLPIFWDAPYSYIHASTDIGEVVDWIKGKFSVTKEGNKYLAVLHNSNKMVNTFASTEWVAGSEGAVLSRSVTSCAGMTAYLVLLAQTRVGFLSGGRGKLSISSPNRSRMLRKKKPIKSNSGPYQSLADVRNYGSLVHAWSAATIIVKVRSSRCRSP